MNTQGAGKTLPIILAAVTLATALFFWKQRDMLSQKTKELLSTGGKQISLNTVATPTPYIYKQTPMATLTPSITPTKVVTPTPTAIPETGSSVKTTKGGVIAKNTTTSTSTVCTPVYGMANSCAEHTVVDTALDTSIFYNLAGLSYFAGLVAFVKAKKRA